jgi:hypothetical protein
MVDLQGGGTPLPPAPYLYRLFINSAPRLYYYKVGGCILQNIKGDTHYNDTNYNINTSQSQNNIKQFIKIVFHEMKLSDFSRLSKIFFDFFPVGIGG